MRRRLVLVSAAITSMVALAFLIPLAGLVGQLAHDRAMNNAERDAQFFASAVALLVPDDRSQVSGLLSSEPSFDGRLTSVIFFDDSVAGAPVPIDSLVESARAKQATTRFEMEGGEALFVPISEGGGRTTLVRIFVPEALLTENVASARLILGLLGVTLVGIAVLVSDRLARSITVPVRELADVAHRMAEGDLNAQVEVSGPREVQEVGRAFNRLSGRIGGLLAVEREAVADLSHRLRTPLTAVRLDIDAVEDGAIAERLREDVGELERTVDYVIREARRPMRQGGGVISDLVAVVTDRAQFWGALADEQQRRWSLSVPDGPRMVAGAAVDFGAAVDALLANVLAHTPAGIGFDVVVADDSGLVRLTISDQGEGFGEEALERGWSGSDSTGLGLDIVRRTVADAGGKLSIRSDGGSVVTAELPLAD
ncbi:MAG TPA: HAMP domain-containing sensor histidine kinase [Acidimicrobiia bacterium]|nr:HAMP domain-containing sensor histidine kinase [Acidimicrobiia bacterium]